MDLGIDGRHALVTGASRGLGRAIALSLASAGAKVVAVARNRERLEELAASTPPGRGSISVRACDLGDAAAIASLTDLLTGVDILVLNGGGPPAGPVTATTDATWSAQFETLFLSAVRLTRPALAGMRTRGFGRIIAVVSSAVVQPIPNLGVSNTMRLAPGRIATDRVAELDQGQAVREGIALEEVQRRSRASIPVGRYGDPEEFAAVVTFLASTRAAYMTGSVVRVDGGLIRSV
jgi:3-oxoacyl-[acyl-carrier protein] reductase